MRNHVIDGRLDLIRDTLTLLYEATELIRRNVAAIQAELEAETDAHYSAEEAAYQAELHAESAAAMGTTHEP